MVTQAVIKVDEPYVHVRSRKGNTYRCVVNPDVSLASIIGYLSQGYEVKAEVLFPHDTPTIVDIDPEIPEVLTEEDIAQQKLEYEQLCGDY